MCFSIAIALRVHLQKNVPRGTRIYTGISEFLLVFPHIQSKPEDKSRHLKSINAARGHQTGFGARNVYASGAQFVTDRYQKLNPGYHPNMNVLGYLAATELAAPHRGCEAECAPSSHREEIELLLEMAETSRRERTNPTIFRMVSRWVVFSDSQVASSTSGKDVWLSTGTRNRRRTLLSQPSPQLPLFG